MLLTFQPLRRSPLFLHIFSFIEQLFTDHILCVWSAIHFFPLPLRNGSKSITKIEVVINVYPVFCVQGFSYPFLLGNQTKVNIKINNWYNTSGLLENTVKLVHLLFNYQSKLYLDVKRIKQNSASAMYDVFLLSKR